MAQDKRKIPIVNNHIRRDGHPGDPATAPGATGGTPAPDPAESARHGVFEESAVSSTDGAREPRTERGSWGDPGADAPADTEDDASTQGDGTEDEPSPLDAAILERDAYLDSLVRLQAEFDNYRRRSQKESTEERSRARGALLAEFLPVFDNLARALDAAEHHEEGKVLEGVRLTHNLFAGLLNKEGVSEIPALGAHFDPHLHEAVITVPSEAEEGVVVQVVEKGYTFGDRVLRPARVVVSAGPAAVDPGGEA